MGSNAQASQLVTHLLTQTTSSLALLESLQVISAQDAQLIRSKLPNAYGPFPSLHTPPTLAPTPTPNLPPRNGSGLDASMSQLAVRDPPPPPPQHALNQTHARALWDYRGNEADDLAFSAGEILVIDEHVNPQWNRGHLLHDPSRRGLFPSNYVEVIPPNSGSGPTSGPGPGPQGMVPYEKQYFGAPPPQHMAPVPYQPPPTGSGPVQQYQSPPPPEHEKKSKFGKIGGQLGNAAVNGAGFGFGASIASEMVHKIF